MPRLLAQSLVIGLVGLGRAVGWTGAVSGVWSLEGSATRPRKWSYSTTLTAVISPRPPRWTVRPCCSTRRLIFCEVACFETPSRAAISATRHMTVAGGVKPVKPCVNCVNPDFQTELLENPRDFPAAKDGRAGKDPKPPPLSGRHQSGEQGIGFSHQVSRHSRLESSEGLAPYHLGRDDNPRLELVDLPPP